jgi:thymidylate synthase (FAD)
VIVLRATVPNVHLISFTDSPNTVIETALLQCQESSENIETKRKNVNFEKRVEHIFKFKHFGVLEHPVATFQITGVSRAFSHQLVRHRVASYAQMSQRVVPVEKMGYIVPPSIMNNTNIKALQVYVDAVRICEDAYKTLTNIYKIPAEDARYNLPNAVETQIVMTMNFRSWLHFLKLRTAPEAQWEVRNVANLIYSHLQKVSPEVFNEKYKEMWE